MLRRFLVSIDAVALLRISAAKARRRAADPACILPLGPDACGVFLGHRHEALEAQTSLAAALVQTALGPALALHDDPRGVLLYPDVAEPKRATYEKLVHDLESGSFWVEPALLALSPAVLMDRMEQGEVGDRAGGFIERLGGLIEREGDGRSGPIVAVDLHQTKPSPHDFQRLSEIRTLRALDLRRVSTLTRSALLQLSNLPALERLTLDELKVGDAELSLLTGMRSLSALSVARTRIQGAGFAALERLPTLTEIVLGYTPLDDEGLRTLLTLPHLQVLKLAPSNITDVGLAYVAKHRGLRVLDASRTRVTDAVVPALLEAPALERLVLRATALTAAGIRRLRSRGGLEVVADAGVQEP